MPIIKPGVEMTMVRNLRGTQAFLAGVVASILAPQVIAATTTVTQLVTAPASGVWTIETTGSTPGAGAITSLVGLGGNLENNQPLPGSAVKLTTGADNNDRANVFLRQDFGSASTFLTTVTLGYSYFKESVGNSNLAAAPSLKLEIYAAGGTGDNFGTLVFEPYWNQGSGIGNPTTGDWQHLLITSSTGSGATEAGGWWWNGGFEQANTAGGPPIRSLAEWAALFSADADFANARVVGIGVGVGSYNLNQVGYFDKVSYQIGETSEAQVYDFEQAAPVPLPAAAWGGIALMGGLFGVKGLKRMRRQA